MIVQHAILHACYYAIAVKRVWPCETTVRHDLLVVSQTTYIWVLIIMRLNTNVFYVWQVSGYLWRLPVVRVAYIQLLFNQLQIQGQ